MIVSIRSVVGGGGAQRGIVMTRCGHVDCGLGTDDDNDDCNMFFWVLFPL